MDIYGKIKKNLKDICEASNVALLHLAEIVSVENDTTCTVSIDGLHLNNVRLRSVVNDEKSGIVLTPKVGSYVLVIDLSDGNLRNLAVLMYSEVDRITINGGDLGGLINIEKLTDKLNEFIKTFNTHTHPVSGEATTAPTSPATTLNKSDYEDKKVTH